MRQRKYRLVVFSCATAALISIVFAVVRCGKSTTAAPTITDTNSALSSIPSTDPSRLDYAKGTATGIVSTPERLFSQDRAGMTILLKIKKGDGLKYDIYQCVNGSQVGYSRIEVASDNYTISHLLRYSQRSTTYNVDVSGTESGAAALTDTNFTASFDLRHNSTGRIVVAADGSTGATTLKGATGPYQLACKWNKTSGCAMLKGQSAVPYAISVAADGTKTYTTASDTSLCPTGVDADFTTVADNATLTSDQTWDCSTGSVTPTTLTVTAPQIEAAGGTACTSTISDHWESSSSDNTHCTGNGTTASSVGCNCDAVFAMGVQSARFLERFFTCKMKGVFSLVKAGTITGVTLDNTGDTAYLKMTLGSR